METVLIGFLFGSSLILTYHVGVLQRKVKELQKEVKGKMNRHLI